MNKDQHFLSTSLKTGHMSKNIVKTSTNFTFVDLFAGIGGIRIALEKNGGKCVFSSEWNKHSRKTYEHNFGDIPAGDITRINAADIPDHAVLAAGFPCQPFSIAGISKKKSLNRPVGFEDKTQGTLFFDIMRIIRKKRPKAVLLENVKNLKTHDNGNTFAIIRESLESLGYDVHEEVIDARKLVPQHRERIYIVAFDTETDFTFPEIKDTNPKFAEILEEETLSKYTLTLGVWKALKRHAEHHRKKGNGFGYGIADPDGVSRTLSARYYKDGAEILISQGRGRRPRRLTPTECCKLMGFPKWFEIPEDVSDCQAYQQFGNSVAVPIVERVAKAMIESMNKEKPITINNVQ